MRVPECVLMEPVEFSMAFWLTVLAELGRA